MLTWLAIACALGAAAMSVRWYRTRVDSLGRKREFPTFTVVVLVVLALGLAYPGLRRVREEHRLARAASTVAGVKVTVHCQGFGEAFTDAGNELGYVKYGADGVPEHHTLIKRDQCADLRSYLGSSKRHPSEAQVIAVHVLTHETMHMRGETDEAVTECEAMQRDALMARELGASPDEANLLARLYWKLTYPEMPEGYRTTDCAPNGKLDEHLPDAPWIQAS